ncbi:MAG: hypothetical protein MJ246_06470 [Clostridia bacterium]|nr:hypothetical protein [Clostridia bacterium]
MEEKNEVKETKKKTKRIGTATFGIMLILLGVLFIISMFTSIEFLKYTFMTWPLFLITLGAECIIYNANDKIEVKYDFGSFILMGFVLLFALCISCCALCYSFVAKDPKIDEVKNKVRSEIVEHISNEVGNFDNVEYEYNDEGRVITTIIHHE